MNGDQPNQAMCLLCDEPAVDDAKIVSDRCRQTLRKASLERRDGLHFRFARAKIIKVHNQCYVSYTGSGNIAAVLKKVNELRPKKQRSAASDFAYNSYCIFCYDDASDSFILKQSKKPREKRAVVQKVQNEKTLERIVSKAKILNTKQSTRLTGLIEKIDLEELRKSNNLPRYHKRCMVLFYKSEPEKPKRIPTGIPIVEHVMNFLENHKDECQFSLKSILESYQGEMLGFSYICDLLIKHHKDEVVIFRKPNHEPLICYKDRAADVLSQSWYEQKSDDPVEERKRLVSAAANILLEDIRGAPCDTKALPKISECYENANQDIPETLKLLCDKLSTKNKKGDLTSHYKKSVNLAHSIMKIVRPNSFVSPIQLGVASLVYEKTGHSKDIVDLLSNFGYTSSHEEVEKFQKLAHTFSKEISNDSQNMNGSTITANDSKNENKETV